ncbi:diguanylate cyclase [Dehalococcoides mccartyi]|uniref:Diguanylate cyclase n=1 Tax=Dehalococcoides mccartyi TaxID=61435 RepID=A0A0V8M2H5_9CHLR|nr:diguanylate cyclase [Dehalococcoides mccartyi]KSV17975.1 diguanylate cyclase [Dehalococcoides mccartyi]
MTIWALVPLVTSIAYIVLLAVVLLSKRQPITGVFSVFLAAAAFWSFTSFMLHLDAPPEQTLFWHNLLNIALFTAMLMYYQFIHVYTNRKNNLFLIIGYITLALDIFFNLTGRLVTSAYIEDNVVYHTITPLFYAVFIFALLFIGVIIYHLVHKYRQSTDPAERNRTLYLVLGWVIVVLSSYTNLSDNPRIYGLPLDHVGNFINAGIIVYAITQYRLIDIKLIARKTLTYVLLFFSMITIYAGALLLATRVFPAEEMSTIILMATLIVLILAMTARPLRTLIEKRIDQLFYQETYESRLALTGFSRKMGNILNLEELAKSLLPDLAKSLNVSKTALLFPDAASGEFSLQYVYPGDDQLKTHFKLASDNPVIAWLDKNNAQLYLNKLDTLPELKGLWQIEKEQLQKSEMGLLYPIKSRDKLIGIIGLGNKKRGGIYSTGDLDLLISVANQAGIIIENAQLYTQATIRANTDELTRLYNHRHFHERIEQEIARGSRFGNTFSLILLDLDLFKVYNDVYGHLAGDQLLRRLGKILENSIRSIDMAFRYGGEEFAIMLPGTKIEDAYHVAERIRKNVETKSSFRDMPITASLGLANWPNDGIMKEEIIAKADAALYHSKETGRNRTSLPAELNSNPTQVINSELEARPKAMSIIYALAATVDAKDHYTYGHSRKVSEYAVALAEILKLPEEKVENIRAAGLLHDIGKIGVPDHILTKPSALDDEEWEPIKTHPELGVEILKRIIDLVNCLPAILHHHEHFDGSGYPFGLKGENIPLEARILSIADAYDAVTSPRPYRTQLHTEQAIAELKRCAGSQFDPALVDIFCRVIKPEDNPQLEASPETGTD